jgi:single-strand DNA-binding protein
MSKKSFNKVILMGNLVRDPELKFLSETAVCNFSIAINDSYKKGDEWIDQVSYFDIVVFKKQAENCNEYLSKGSPVLVEGKLRQRRWEAKDGTKRSKIEIVASNVVFLGSKDDKGNNNTNDTDEVVDEDGVPF